MTDQRSSALGCPPHPLLSNWAPRDRGPLWIILVAALTMGCVLDAPTAPPSDRTEGLSSGSLDFIEEVPIEEFNDLIVISANLEGYPEVLRFVLSTSGASVIRSGILAEAKTFTDPSLAGVIAEDSNGRALDYKPVVLKSVRIGSLRIPDVPAVAVDSDVFQRFCPPIDGLLGTGGISRFPGFLDQVTMEVNRDTGRMRITRGFARLDDGVAVIPIRRYLLDRDREKLERDTSRVPAGIEDQTLWAEFATGVSGLSEMDADTFESLGHSLAVGQARNYLGVSGYSLGGLAPTARSWLVDLGSVYLGRFELQSVSFRIVEPREDGLPTLRLSQDVLQYFNFVTDHRRNEIRLSPRANMESIHTGLPTQLAWDVRDGRAIVVGMLADGAAAQADIELGDEVVAIGDITIDPGDPESVCSARAQRERASGEYVVTIRRGGREHSITLPTIEPSGRP